MSFEGALSAGVGLAGVGVDISKEIEGNRLDTLFAAGGWEVRASAELGGKLGGKLGPASAEVAAVRTATLYESSATSPEAALSDVKAHAREIEQAAKRAQR